MARVGDPRHDRHPDDLPHAPDRAAVRRPAHGAAPDPPARRARRRDPRRPLDGRAHVQGRGREGGARERGRQAVPSWAQKQGFADNPKAVAGAKLFAQSGCTDLPHVSRHRVVEPRRARPERERREEQGGRSSSDRTSANPRKCNNTVDAGVRDLGSAENIRNIGDLPRRLEGRAVAECAGECASSSA